MTAGLLLAGYAVAAGVGGPAVLCRDWVRRSPRTAIAVWLTLAGSWLAALVLAGLAAVTGLPLSWQAPAGRAAGMLSVPGGMPAVAGMLPGAAVVLLASWHLARGLGRVRREQRAHAAFLAAVGRPDQALDAVIIDDASPAAYCLPGGRHRVVISAGALSRLRPGQLQAVLAHERAHLRGRHHLMLAAAAALGRAFPPVPLLARAPGELAVLAEMAADDTAARRHDPADLAAALVTLASASARPAALAAGGPAAIARIQRLLAPAAPPRLPARTARLAAGAAALIIPAAITSLPVIIAACDIITTASLGGGLPLRQHLIYARAACRAAVAGRVAGRALLTVRTGRVRPTMCWPTAACPRRIPLRGPTGREDRVTRMPGMTRAATGERRRAPVQAIAGSGKQEGADAR